MQFGFISGTLIFALLSIADRFSPSKVFFYCALAGAGFTAALSLEANNFSSLLLLRFATGFFLAGIYPVGMKIASDYFEAGLGKSLGFLVGALVLGTGFPHLLKVISGNWPWQAVIWTTAILASVGGLLIGFLVPDGPYRKASAKVDLSAAPKLLQLPALKNAAYGYFGHMWELYAFWAFVPMFLAAYAEEHQLSMELSLWSFIIIAMGAPACVFGALRAQEKGEAKVAYGALRLSGLACLLSPLVFLLAPWPIFLLFLALWAMVVIADSPLFSTLVARSAPQEFRGTALTMVNSIGFALTIVSIQLVGFLERVIPAAFLMLILVLGPIFGLLQNRPRAKE